MKTALNILLVVIALFHTANALSILFLIAVGKVKEDLRRPSIGTILSLFCHFGQPFASWYAVSLLP